MNKYFIISLLILFFSSCSNNDYYQKTYNIENEVWETSNNFQFNIDINDNKSVFDILINIRNNIDYEFANIFMFVSILYPDNTLKIDTVEGYLSNSKGEWFGKGSGRYRNNQFIYKKNIIFPQKGKYVINIEQAMRERSLIGVSTVGLEVKYKK